MPLTANVPKGYCTSDDIAAFLGTSFTDDQLPHVNATIARTEAWLDGELNRSWNVGPIVGEEYYAPYGLNPPTFFTSYVAGWVPLGADIHLRNVPVQEVNRVQGIGWLGTPPVEKVRDLEWELRDYALGIVRIVVPSAFYKLRIDYVPVPDVPADITQATIMMAATYLLPMLSPDSWLVDQVTLPDLTVKYARASNTQQVPPEVTEIIQKYRFRSIG